MKFYKFFLCNVQNLNAADIETPEMLHKQEMFF